MNAAENESEGTQFFLSPTEKPPSLLTAIAV